MIVEAGAMPAPLWLIGCGNMGGAMLRRWVAAGADPASITVVDLGTPDVPAGVRLLHAAPLDAEPAAVVLAVKPQQLDAIASLLSSLMTPMLVSVLAGVETATLAARCPGAETVVRAMPNLPVGIGQGVTALYASDADDRACQAAEALARPLGHVEWIADEALFDAVTALSGCGPGFTFRFIDAMAAAGEALGLPADQAGRLARATVSGSGAMAAVSDESPATLADRVASPGGSTRAGLDILDREEALKRLMAETLVAAARRNAEMAAEAR